MKYLMIGIMVLGVIMAIAGGASLGGASGSFDLETATPEERAEWLEKQAGPIVRGVGWGLPQGHQPMQPKLVVHDHSVDGNRMEIRVVIRAETEMRLNGNVAEAKRLFLEKTCKAFKRTALYEANGRVVVEVQYQTGARAMSFSSTPSSCDATLERMARAGA